MTKFPDNSLTLIKWPKFPDIFSKFPDNSLTWRKFCFSLTFPWHVATLSSFTISPEQPSRSGETHSQILPKWKNSLKLKKFWSGRGGAVRGTPVNFPCWSIRHWLPMKKYCYRMYTNGWYLVYYITYETLCNKLILTESSFSAGGGGLSLFKVSSMRCFLWKEIKILLVVSLATQEK